jgi:hypothetical protein
MTDTNAAFNHAKAFMKFYLLLPRVAHLIVQIVCIAKSRGPLEYMVVNTAGCVLESLKDIVRLM